MILYLFSIFRLYRCISSELAPSITLCELYAERLTRCHWVHWNTVCLEYWAFETSHGL